MGLIIELPPEQRAAVLAQTSVKLFQLAAGTTHVRYGDMTGGGRVGLISENISMAVDRSGTASNGNVYIAWQDGRNLQIPSFTISGTYAYADVLPRKSSDGGVTWSPVVRINDNPEPLPDGGGTDQYQPGVAVDGWGKVGVCFYDRRHDPQNFMIDRYCAVSTDAGTTWLNKRQSSPSWAPSHATDFEIDPFYMGDYDSLASDFTKTTPGFIGAFQISNTRGGISGNSIPVPNQDVVAVKVQ